MRAFYWRIDLKSISVYVGRVGPVEVGHPANLRDITDFGSIGTVVSNSTDCVVGVVEAYDPATGRIETKERVYLMYSEIQRREQFHAVRIPDTPSRLYKPAHGGYPDWPVPAPQITR